MKEHKHIHILGKPMLAAAALALVISSSAAYSQPIVVTPDQFTFSTWNNLQYSTVGAFPGDNANGYAYTPNYSASPSALVNIPLNGLAPGWNAYNIYEWIPTTSIGGANAQWHAVNVINNGIGYGTSVVPGEPWAGQFGTQQQWLGNNNSPTGWLKLGPGPQSDPTLDGGSGVWINGSGAPSYLQIHYYGFETGLETFDTFVVVPVGTAIPEPSTMALCLLGGLALLGINFRRAKN